jgi:hypothetical protein
MRQLGDDQMDLLVHNSEGVTIHLNGSELLTAMVLIQEGRLAFGCDDCAAQALDELFRSALSLVEEARIPGRIISRIHNQPKWANQTGQ